jgi:hypothetical protein
MIGNLLKKYFGWRHPERPFVYEVRRLKRDVFEVKLPQGSVLVPVEVGDRINGKYEATVYIERVGRWEGREAPLSATDREMLFGLLEEFFLANDYVPKRR